MFRWKKQAEDKIGSLFEFTEDEFDLESVPGTEFKYFLVPLVNIQGVRKILPDEKVWESAAIQNKD